MRVSRWRGGGDEDGECCGEKLGHRRCEERVQKSCKASWRGWSKRELYREMVQEMRSAKN